MKIFSTIIKVPGIFLEHDSFFLWQKGAHLSGFYKLYVARKKYRIVYRLIGVHTEVIEIEGIGKKNKGVYRIVAKRVKRMLKR